MPRVIGCARAFRSVAEGGTRTRRLLLVAIAAEKEHAQADRTQANAMQFEISPGTVTGPIHYQLPYPQTGPDPPSSRSPAPAGADYNDLVCQVTPDTHSPPGVIMGWKPASATTTQGSPIRAWTAVRESDVTGCSVTPSTRTGTPTPPLRVHRHPRTPGAPVPDSLARKDACVLPLGLSTAACPPLQTDFPGREQPLGEPDAGRASRPPRASTRSSRT
jgi:hypothetical protein